MVKRVFAFISVIFILFMVCFYGYRLIYFYNYEHSENSIPLLTEYMITHSKKLSLVDNEYYYKGNVSNNYIYFNGLYYRVISFNEFNLTLICDEDVTKLKYGLNDSYRDSDIKLWLNDIYLNNLDKKVLYQDYVSLLDKDMYIKIGADDSFIESNNMWMLDKNQGLVLSEEGTINIPESYNYYLNVRPIIKIRNRKYVNGNGTYENPYTLYNEEINNLKNTYVGNYIKYKDLVYRVISKDENNNIKVVSVESIGKHIYSTSTNIYKNTNKKDLYYYLNNEYINKLNKDNLVLTKFNNGPYNASYKDTESNKVEANVGLLSIGDYFINNISGYTLSTSNNYIYMIKDDTNLFMSNIKNQNEIYPVFTLNGELKIINGDGTVDYPYEVGE